MEEPLPDHSKVNGSIPGTANLNAPSYDERTVVELLPKHPKVQGSSPSAATRTCQEREREWQNVFKPMTMPWPLAVAQW